jgi:hypothetical protein
MISVLDLRTEIFSKEYVEAYIRTWEVRPGWQEVIAETKPTYAVLRSESPIRRALQE